MLAFSEFDLSLAQAQKAEAVPFARFEGRMAGRGLRKAIAFDATCVHETQHLRTRRYGASDKNVPGEQLEIIRMGGGWCWNRT